MKKFLALALMISSFSVFAECYSFYNGVGPSRVGQVKLAAPASRMCYSQSGRGEMLRFSDSEGELAIVEVTSSRERRPNGQVVFNLSYGNSNGRNADFTGSKVVIEAGTIEAPEATVRRVLVNGVEFFAQ